MHCGSSVVLILADLGDQCNKLEGRETLVELSGVREWNSFKKPSRGTRRNRKTRLGRTSPPDRTEMADSKLADCKPSAGVQKKKARRRSGTQETFVLFQHLQSKRLEDERLGGGSTRPLEEVAE